jgi:Uncharacterized protein conserved in bacteria
LNWLAHILLSKPTAAFRIGNLLPDLLPKPALHALPNIFHEGIEQHIRIDRFTDTHPIVKRSIQRIGPAHRRFAGILVDVFYDFFLTHDWNRYSSKPLDTVAIEFYSGIDEHRHTLPSVALDRLDGIRAENLLCSYGSMGGIGVALDRIGSRLRRPVALGCAISELEKNGTELKRDFEEFFPQLRRSVKFHAASSIQPIGSNQN